MSKSLGNLVLVSTLRAQGVEPSAIRLGLLAGHYRADRFWSPQVLDDAIARLQRWRAAIALPAGPDAADVVARVRGYLADDLDTPKVIAALDGWVTDALEYGGHDAEAPRSVADRGRCVARGGPVTERRHSVATALRLCDAVRILASGGQSARVSCPLQRWCPPRPRRRTNSTMRSSLPSPRAESPCLTPTPRSRWRTRCVPDSMQTNPLPFWP